MAAAKRVKSAGGRRIEPDKSSPEDERALNRLLALINGRGEPEDRRADQQRRD
jgi:hypothetical protein